MSIKRGAALLLLAAVIALVSLQAGNLPGVFSYCLPSPHEMPREDRKLLPAADEAGEAPAPEETKKPAPTAMEERLKSLKNKMEDLSGTALSYGVTAYAPATNLGDGGSAGVTALVMGQWGNVLLPKAPLAAGRQLYLEEIALGSPVAVIDEQLAIALYRVGDPVGRQLVISGKPFTVVGVVRKPRTAGDQEERRAEVPLGALIKAGIPTQMMAVNLLPKPGSGAYAALSQGMAQWQSGGTFYSLAKESYRARLPLRILLCLMGLAAISLTLRLSARAIRGLVHHSKRRLQSQYAARLLPGFAGKALLALMLITLNLGALFLILQALVAPVYVFPEWVPAILVEPREILKTFWALRAQATPLIALRTPEVLRLQFLHRLMTLACTGFGFLLVKPYGTLRQRLGLGKGQAPSRMM